MEYRIFDIIPVAKPRQTRAQKWNTRPIDRAYYKFKDDIRDNIVELPDSGFHVIFIRPMPEGWNPTKKDVMRHEPCQSTPDFDNLLKALLDSLFKNDSHIWNGTATKVWGDAGRMIIITGIETDWIKPFLNDVIK